MRWFGCTVCPKPRRILGSHDMGMSSRARWLTLLFLGRMDTRTLWDESVLIVTRWLLLSTANTHTVPKSPAAAAPPPLPLSLSFTLSRLLLHLCTSLHHHPLPTDTHTMRTTHRLLLMSGQGHSQADSPRIELSSVSPQACVRAAHVCLCVCACVCVSVTLGWECTVGGYCQHAQAGVYGQRHRTWFDHHLGDSENMTNMPVCVRESPPGFQTAFPLLHSRSAQTRSHTCGLHSRDEAAVTNKINHKKKY